MKPFRPVAKSLKTSIIKIETSSGISKEASLGLTIIPIGSDDLFVELPNLSKTYTYNIINTDEMTGNITLRTSGGASLKGLMLRSNGGSLSIDPIQVGTDELTLESDVKDGCYIQTVSNGNKWFIWSIATGGTISVRTGGVITTHTPTPPVPVYADITNVTITSDVRFVGGGLEARHDLVLSGEGEPGASLTISETTGNSDAALVFPVTIQIAQDGTWELDRNTLATNLPNATYTFDFNPTLGNGVQNQSFIGDTGPINFTVPSTFTPDPAEVVDFASGASAVRPDSTQIAVVVDSSAWNPNLVHGDTFDIIYSITDPAVNGGVTVSQTVTGTIVDDTPPAAPVISAASIANINELSANGTAEPNKTITLFQDNLPLSPTVTSDGAGNWSFGPVVLNFNSNFTLKAQASEAGVGNPNRSAFGEYSPAFNYVQPVTPTPTIGVNGEQTSVWTNTNNSLTISGTTEIGATIEVLDGANPATLVSGPTVDGAGYWTATIDVAPESVTSLSAKATLAGHLTSQAASFQLNVDRVPPVITVTGATQTVYLGNIGDGNDQGATATDFSSATVSSDWSTAVDATEGAKTVTYTAIDAAGNTANATRTVNVTTEVVVPTNLVAVDNGDGTVTLTGDVTGIYADNLQVKINAIDSLGLEEVYQESNLDVLFTVTGGSFTAIMTLTADTYTFEAQTINSIGETSLFDDCTASSPVTVAAAPVPSTNFLEDSSSLVLDQSFVNNGWLEYTTSGTLKHTFASNTGNGGIASIPVSLFSNTNTPSNIIYSLWFKIDVGKGGQSRMLKGTTGGNPATVNPSGPGIVWEAVGGGVFRLIEATSGITNGVGANTHPDGTDARFYYDAGNSLAQGSWHHVIVQHSWDGANSRWISNVFINGARATTADGTSVSDVHIDSGNTSQSILNTNGNNYLVCTRATTIDSYNVVMDSSDTITEGIASAIYSDSTRQTGIAAALAMDTTAPVMTITNTDTGLELSDGDTVNLVDGDAFNFTAVTDDGSPVVIAQGGSPVSSGTTFTTGTYSVTFDSTDGVNAASTITITLEVVAAANFIEDIQSVINRAAGQANISIVNGIVIDTDQSSPNHGLSVRLSDDGIVTYDSVTGETVNDEFTISFWANLDSQGDNTYFMGTNSGRRLYFYLGGTTNATFRLGWNDGTSNLQHFKNSAGTFTSWTHFALTVEKTSTNIVLSVYINGSKVVLSQSQTAPLGTKIFPPLANQVLKFGGVEGVTGQTKSVSGQFDSIQIGDGIALSADQILWISQDSLRQRSIAGAVAAINTAPTIELNGDSNLFHPLGQSFNDPGATAQDQADGDLTSSIQTTIVNSQGGSVSAIDATSPEDTYTITYSVTDSGGLSATVTRTVLVSAVITTSSLLTTQTVTLNGSATLTNGILDLPGANGDYATIAGSSNYDPSGGITYSAWVYLDTLKNQQGILSNIFSTTSWDGISIQFQKNNTYPNGFVVVACNGPSGINSRIDDVPIDSSNNPVAITTGVWHFLAVTFNPTGGECIAYFNGVALNQTLSGAQIAHNNSWPFYIGAQRDSNNINYTVDGQIQGVRIEQTIKSASQLLATYNAGPQ